MIINGSDINPKQVRHSFCDIQNVSLLKMTSTRASPWAVLYNNILELSELCMSSVIEIDCEKKSRAC